MDAAEVFDHPKVPDHVPLLWPPPRITSRAAAKPTCEPLLPPCENAQANYQARQSRRKADPSSVLNRIVYDAVDPSPFHGSNGGSGSSGSGGGGAVVGGSNSNNSSSSRGGGSRGGSTTVAGSGAAAALAVRTLAPIGKLRPWYPVKRRADARGGDDTLQFESRFESGNLRRAIQIFPSEYDLVAKPDLYTSQHTQWFYFSVTNAVGGRRYTFNIINMLKKDSLYNSGMQPLMYSTEAAAEKSTGWSRCGEDVLYVVIVGHCGRRRW
jgi:hypothetical protein